jgi:hypothetical protein
MLIYKKIPLVMAEIGYIEKSSRNQSQGYAFRGIDAVQEAFQPVLAKHGVFCAPNVVKQEREERPAKSGGTLLYTVLTIEYTFYCEDGSSVKVTTVGEAMDSGDKSANKAMSAAMKYALTQLFCVPTEGDNDTENSSPEPLAKKSTPPQNKGNGFTEDEINSQFAKAAAAPTNYKPSPFVSEQVKILNGVEGNRPHADYVFPKVVKKYAGKTLGQVSPTEVMEYANYMENYLSESGKKEIKGDWKICLENIKAYAGGN